MKFEMIFLTAVIGIGIIHLLFSLVNFLAKPRWAGVQESRKEKVRADDWYAFFSKSALYGDIEDSAVQPEIAIEEAFELYLVCEEKACQPQEAYT